MKLLPKLIEVLGRDAPAFKNTRKPRFVDAGKASGPVVEFRNGVRLAAGRVRAQT